MGRNAPGREAGRVGQGGRGRCAMEAASDVEKLKSMWLVCRLEQKVDGTASRWVCRPRLTSEFEENG